MSLHKNTFSHLFKAILVLFLASPFFLLPSYIFSSSSSTNNDTASLWVGEKKEIIEVSPDQGDKLSNIETKYVEDVAVDNNRGMVWVGMRKEVIKYTFAGDEVLRYFFHNEDHDDDDDNEEEGEGERVVQISLDPSDGSLWIGAKDEVLKISSGGQALFKIKAGHVEDISVDISDGSCWAALKYQVIRYSSKGSILQSIEFKKDDKIYAIAADPLTHSLYAGGKKALTKVDSNGIKFTVAYISDIQDIKTDINDGSILGNEERGIQI